MGYPDSYHTAASHLVSFGVWRYRLSGRRKLAVALHELRRAKGHTQAHAGRHALLFITGMFPAKHTDPRYSTQAWAQPEKEDR